MWTVKRTAVALDKFIFVVVEVASAQKKNTSGNCVSSYHEERRPRNTRIVVPADMAPPRTLKYVRGHPLTVFEGDAGVI